MLVPHSDLVEDPQPIEVAQVESPAKMENHPVDDPPTMKFTWTIENFTRLTKKKQYSDVFIANDYKWRILIFPKGQDVVDHLSMFLDVADSSSLPNGWSRDAQFSLFVVDQINNKFSVRKDEHHLFNAEESDWGFSKFIPLQDLCDPNRAYLVNNTIVIEAQIVVTKKVTACCFEKEKSGPLEEANVEEADANFQVPGDVGSQRREFPSSPQTGNEVPSVSPPRERSPPRVSPLPVSRDVVNEVAVVESSPVIEFAPVPTPLCPSPAPFVAPSPIATSPSSGTADPAASIALPDDDDSDLALFESIGITFPSSKQSRTTTFDALTSSATIAKTPSSKRAEILKALGTVVCYLHDVKVLKDVDSNAEPPLAVFKALETLKTQGSGLLPEEMITMISKLSTGLAHTVSRYKVRHDLLRGIATDEKDIEARTKAFEDADATIRTMSMDYWEARQQRDAKRKEFVAVEDEVSRLQAELARAQERASELQSQLTEAEQRRLTSFRACAVFKDTVYESARIERERVAVSLELKKALYAKEKDDLDIAHDFLLDVISCLDTEVEASLRGPGTSVGSV